MEQLLFTGVCNDERYGYGQVITGFGYKREAGKTYILLYGVWLEVRESCIDVSKKRGGVK